MENWAILIASLFLKCRSTNRSEQWSRLESEWRLEAEKHKAEAERLKGQVEALKETADRYRTEMRDKDSALNRFELCLCYYAAFCRLVAHSLCDLTFQREDYC